MTKAGSSALDNTLADRGGEDDVTRREARARFRDVAAQDRAGLTRSRSLSHLGERGHAVTDDALDGKLQERGDDDRDRNRPVVQQRRDHKPREQPDHEVAELHRHPQRSVQPSGQPIDGAEDARFRLGNCVAARSGGRRARAPPDQPARSIREPCERTARARRILCRGGRTSLGRLRHATACLGRRAPAAGLQRRARPAAPQTDGTQGATESAGDGWDTSAVVTMVCSRPDVRVDFHFDKRARQTRRLRPRMPESAAASSSAEPPAVRSHGRGRVPDALAARIRYIASSSRVTNRSSS